MTSLMKMTGIVLLALSTTAFAGTGKHKTEVKKTQTTQTCSPDCHKSCGPNCSPTCHPGHCDKKGA